MDVFKTAELWIEHQSRGETTLGTILIPMEDVTPDNVHGVYLLKKEQMEANYRNHFMYRWF